MLDFSFLYCVNYELTNEIICCFTIFTFRTDIALAVFFFSIIVRKTNALPENKIMLKRFFMFTYLILPVSKTEREPVGAAWYRLPGFWLCAIPSDLNL
jgi:hypothetical protein